jgi:hypothetical protein
MDPATIGALTSAGIALYGMLANSGSGGAEMTQEQKILLADTLRQQNNRMRYQNPLYEAVTNLAMNLMPKSAFQPNGYQPRYLEGPKPWITSQPGIRRPSGDATYIGQAVRRGTTVPTDDAVTALANGLQSPMNVYRDQMSRGRA